MNIYLQELRAYRKSTIIWIISLIALLALYMSMFASLTRDAQSFIEILEGYPENVRIALGMHLESITSLLGFSGFILTYVTLIGAIQAMNIGLSIVSKEVRERTADFLMTKPVSRTKILTAKLLAALSLIVLTNAVYLIAAVYIANQVKTTDYDLGVFLMISITLLFIQLMFLAIGITLSVVLPKIKSVLPISLGAVFGFFFIGAFGASSSDDPMRYLTPFKYFDTMYIVQNAKYETSFIITSIIWIGVAILLSYYVYKKKNIHAV